MSRIFEDQDAKAMILVIGLLIAVPLLGALAVPKHAAAPGSTEAVASESR